MTDIVQRLRMERRATAWRRGLDCDFPTAFEQHPLCQEAAAEITRLRAEAEALRKDAERYRWLRERVELRKERAVSGSVRDSIQMRTGQSFLDTPTRGARGYCDEFEFTRECSRLDAAIDATKGTT